MEFLNARRGVNAIFMAAVFQLISALIIGVSGIAEGAITIIISYSSLAVSLISTFMLISGIIAASKDEDSFLDALWLVALTAVTSILNTVLPMFGIVFVHSSFIVSLIDTMSIIFILKGITSLYIKKGDEKMAKRGNRASVVMTTAIVINLIVQLMVEVNGLSNWALDIISVVGMLVYIVLIIVAYVKYLTYLNKARKTL